MAILLKGMRAMVQAMSQALIALGACLLLVALVIFSFKAWAQYSWPRTNGIVVASSIETQNADGGTRMCSAVESVQYVVNGHDFIVKSGGYSFTSRCSDVETQVAFARGQTRPLIYDQRRPGTAYLNPGFNLGFHDMDFVFACAAGGFAIGGWLGVKLSRLMVKKKIDFA